MNISIALMAPITLIISASHEKKFVILSKNY